MSSSSRSALALSVLLVAALAVPSGAAESAAPAEDYRQGDLSITALSILPPGQGRHLNSAEAIEFQSTGTQPAMNTNQQLMYQDMIKAAPNVTEADLNELFKDHSFGVPPENISREYSPRAGVVIQRDEPYQVPHVYGTTRSDTMFGAGYVTAEDRMFMMDVLRHVGRGRSSELLGPSEANLAMDREAYKNAGYSEQELQRMINRLPELDPELGPIAVQDLEDFTAGVNQFFDEARSDPTLLPAEYPALQIVPEDWAPTDTVAVASLIGSQLGVGGGDELANAKFLAHLRRTHKPSKAKTIFRDFRGLDDREAPTVTDKSFPYLTDLGPVNAKSIAMPDHPGKVLTASAEAPVPVLDGPFGPINLSFADAMSNALLVGSDLSASGNALAVFGPQTAYWSPEILMEMDLHGPGIATRGVGFPGISQYTLLGRGRDYAWSATSAGGDQVDIFAERLCEPKGPPTQDSNHYIKNGKCVEMYTRTDTWTSKPTAGGAGPPTEVEMTTQRTNNGIVQARGTVNSKPVAFVQQRASFKREVDSALTYIEISDPAAINGPKDFQRAFGRFAFSFNWFYVDKDDIAYVLGGYYPHRRRGSTRSLPMWGTGPWDWKGNLTYKELAKDISPSSGYMTSWNNKPAPGWGASDGQFSYGSIYRDQLLDDRVKKYAKNGSVTLVELVNAMGDAATADLRGSRVLPFMLDVIGTPKSDRMKQAVDVLDAWVKSGAHRRSRDDDAEYDDAPAVALMDAWWVPALEAVFKPRLGKAFKSVPQKYDDHPGPLGSAFQTGWYGYVQKDLRTLLGKRVRDRYTNSYCGKGILRDCRAALRKSLSDAIKTLEEAFGADPDAWEADEEADMIQFTAVGLVTQDPMRWQNRPTYQQVVEFGSP